jgi:RNA polymerase sigma-70 factor (ECF subfamily)
VKESSSDIQLELLFQQYFRPLTVFALQYVKAMEAAEDIVQEVFVYLYEKGDLEKKDPFPGTFLYRMVRNRCLNYIDFQNIRRNSGADLEETIVAAGNPHDPMDYIEEIELEHTYLQSLEALSPKCRKVFTMSRIEGIPNQEIAVQLKLSKRTIETHISQALKILREKLKDFISVILF